MLNNLSLGLKIGGGFLAVLLGTIAIGGAGITALTYIQSTQHDADEVAQVRVSMYDARVAAVYYLIDYDAVHSQKCRTLLGETRKLGEAVRQDLTSAEAVPLDAMLEAIGSYDGHLQAIETTVAANRALATRMVEIGQGLDRSLTALDGLFQAKTGTGPEAGGVRPAQAQETLDHLEAALLRLMILRRDFMITPGATQRAAVEAGIGALVEGVARITTTGNPAVQAEVQKLNTVLTDYRGVFKDYADGMMSIEGKVKTWRETGVQMVGKLGEVTGLVTARMAKANVTAMTAMVVLGILVAVVSLLLAWLITRAITRPIACMCSALDRVAAGDLTVTTGLAQRDEVGQMAAALDRTVAGLSQVITEIRTAADQTAASSEELSASAQNISSGAQSQASTVEEISASVQELTKSIEEVAHNAAEANQVAQRTSSTAEGGRQSVARSVEGMKAINDSSDRIAKIIGVINQIASQTNLLALNAAIEAASAGEHGLGFAVVADEVRKLAERSSQAAQEIAQLIDESGKRVGEGTTLSQEVGRSLASILEGIGATTQGMAGISAATEEQATTAKEVGTNIEGISAITEENSASAEEMAASAEELSAQAQRLQELVARFRLDAVPTAAPAASRPAVAAAAAGPAKRVTAPAAAPAAGKALYHE